MQLFSLGDTAVTLELGPAISETLNDKVLSVNHWLQTNPFEGMVEIIAAYNSLTVYYDPYVVMKKYKPGTSIFCWVKEKLLTAVEQSPSSLNYTGIIHRIPVCYHPEFGIDLAQLAFEKQVSIQQIIEWHTSTIYRVYMMGFMPGFPYLGEVIQSLATPRKLKPMIVEAGSVGIAGNQTGVYPFNSPGGWNIVGRTPRSLFDRHKNPPVWIKAGDKVQFFQIGKERWESDEWKREGENTGDRI